ALFDLRPQLPPGAVGDPVARVPDGTAAPFQLLPSPRRGELQPVKKPEAVHKAVEGVGRLRPPGLAQLAVQGSPEVVGTGEAPGSGPAPPRRARGSAAVAGRRPVPFPPGAAGGRRGPAAG